MKSGLEFEDVLDLIKIHRNGSQFSALIDGLNVELVRGTIGLTIHDSRDLRVLNGDNKFLLSRPELYHIMSRTDLDYLFKRR